MGTNVRQTTRGDFEAIEGHLGGVEGDSKCET